MAAMFFLFSFTLETVKELSHGKELSMQLQTDMLSLRRHEKDFLARKDKKYQERFDKQFKQINADLEELETLLNNHGMRLPAHDALAGTFSTYQANFHRVVDAYESMGFDHKSGLTGELRAAVHGVESALKAIDADSVLVTMLQLRRAEKDFMLRSDLKYLKKFNGLHQVLLQQLNTLSIDSVQRQDILNLAKAYQSKFIAYVDGAKTLGLNSQSGFRLEMRTTVQSSEKLLLENIDTVDKLLHDSLDKAQVLSMLLFIGLLLITAIVAWFVGRSIFLPVQKIQQAIQNIHQSQDLSLRVDATGKDEIAAMADTLNTMLVGFQKVIANVNHAVDAMNNTAEGLSNEAHRTSSDIERQKVETDLVAAAMTEMVSTVEEIARNTENAAFKVNQTHDDATSGQEQVRSAIAHIRGLSGKLEGSMSTVEELAQESETIGSVLGVIQGIAEQTNLLALNAAIEAARAGEQGRGFAVVADEVRALAGRTQDATEEISSIISSLQVKTKGIVELMHDCRQDGLNSRDQAAQVESVLAGITADVTEISDMTNQVAAAIEEQSSVANEVGQNVVTIRDITEDAAEAVRRNSQACQDISDQAGALRKTVSVFKV
jgi:methyl-accepting chemotaxis protein